MACFLAPCEAHMPRHILLDGVKTWEIRGCACLKDAGVGCALADALVEAWALMQADVERATRAL